MRRNQASMRRGLLRASLVFPFVTACTWVKMAPGAESVRVAAAGQSLAACEKRGEVAVSVKDRLGPVERNALKVRDELETLARNEAPGMGADTIQPKSEPEDGAQRFLTFRCGPGSVVQAGTAPAQETLPEGEAETFPVEQ